MMDFDAHRGMELDHDAAWDYIRDGYLHGSRTVLKGRTKTPQPVLQAPAVDLSKLAFIAQQTLEAAIGNIAGTRRAVMFSGGFDSMLVACLAQRSGAHVTAVTIQFDDFNPLTVAGSIEFAKKAGIEHHILHVKAVEFLSAFEALAGITDGPMLDLDLAVVYAALKKYDPKIAGDVFIAGMGSDQWFGDEALEAMPEGLMARLDRARADEDAHQRVAEAHGYKFVFPFLSLPMLALSQSVPAAMKKDKQLLRALAVANTISDRGTRSEVQVPPLMRHILIKTYGDRAWPSPVSVGYRDSREDDQILRQIILGLWWEKVKV
jgi:asparagine synthetase B (glutamine-hydrolysing)